MGKFRGVYIDIFHVSSGHSFCVRQHVHNKLDMNLAGHRAYLLAVLCITAFIFTYMFSSSLPRVLNLATIFSEYLASTMNDTSFYPDELCNVTQEPLVSIVPWQRVTYPGKKWKGLQLPLIVIGSSGRLGNLMGNYASILGMGRAYNVTIRIDVDLQTTLLKIFPNLRIPAIDVNATRSAFHTLSYLGNYVYGDKEAAAAGLLGPHPFLLEGYPLEIQLFHPYACDILEDFTFAPDIQEKVRDFWLSEKTSIEDAVLVGFHIRRDDYLKYVMSRGEMMPNETYYNNAMTFYRIKFPKVVFVIGSDDREYVSSVFKNSTDVIFVPGKSPEEDMAILASCNHSIITVGTFGFWSAYLAGGLVVYPGDFYIPNYPLQKDRYERAKVEDFIPVSST